MFSGHFGGSIASNGIITNFCRLSFALAVPKWLIVSLTLVNMISFWIKILALSANIYAWSSLSSKMFFIPIEEGGPTSHQNRAKGAHRSKSPQGPAPSQSTTQNKKEKTKLGDPKRSKRKAHQKN